MELVVARNPDPDSSLPYLLRVPLNAGLVLRARDTWPRTRAIYCHPVPLSEWPASPDVVECIPLRACSRRGAAIDIVADRAREQRSQLVFTRARGRDVVFWQSPRTTRQSRPDVRLPTARAAGLTDLVITVDAHEHYPYRFAGQQVGTVRGALRCGDYAVHHDGRLVASVERKSLDDLVGSLSSGRLRYALGELSALPRAAVVIEDRWANLFKLKYARPAAMADQLAELQVRWSGVPIVWCENRKLAEEWTYRFLAAAYRWAEDEVGARARLDGLEEAPAPARTAGSRAAGPAAAVIRAWARSRGLAVPDRGPLPAAVRQEWNAHQAGDGGPGDGPGSEQ